MNAKPPLSSKYQLICEENFPFTNVSENLKDLLIFFACSIYIMFSSLHFPYILTHADARPNILVEYYCIQLSKAIVTPHRKMTVCYSGSC
jgi:hypothetical protein